MGLGSACAWCSPRVSLGYGAATYEIIQQNSVSMKSDKSTLFIFVVALMNSTFSLMAFGLMAKGPTLVLWQREQWNWHIGEGFSLLVWCYIYQLLCIFFIVFPQHIESSVVTVSVNWIKNSTIYLFRQKQLGLTQKANLLNICLSIKSPETEVLEDDADWNKLFCLKNTHLNVHK